MNRLRATGAGADSSKGQVGCVIREMEFLRNDPRQVLDITNPVTEIRNPFNGLTGHLDLAEEGISQLEDVPIESFKTK